MLAAEWGVGQVLWSMLWFFLFFLWIWLVISIFADIIRSKDMGGVAKAIWSIFIIFVPYLGVFMTTAFPMSSAGITVVNTSLIA